MIGWADLQAQQLTRLIEMWKELAVTFVEKEQEACGQQFTYKLAMDTKEIASSDAGARDN